MADGKIIVEKSVYKGTPMFTVRPENVEPYKVPNFGPRKWGWILGLDKDNTSVLMQLVKHQERHNDEFEKIEPGLDHFVEQYLLFKADRDPVFLERIRAIVEDLTERKAA